MPPHNDEILDLFVREIRKQLGPQIKQIILFGSRARGDFTPDSDYDCLLIVDEITPAVEETIYEITGEFLYKHNELFSVFPVLEEKYYQKTYEPLFMNVRKEGVVL